MGDGREENQNETKQGKKKGDEGDKIEARIRRRRLRRTENEERDIIRKQKEEGKN